MSITFLSHPIHLPDFFKIAKQEQERSRLLRSWNNERLLSKASNAYEARYQTAVVKGR